MAKAAIFAVRKIFENMIKSFRKVVDNGRIIWYNECAVIYGTNRKVTDTYSSSDQKICEDQSFGQRCRSAQDDIFLSQTA